MDESVASGSGRKKDIDGGKFLKEFAKEEESAVKKLSNQSFTQGQESGIEGRLEEDKENLLEYCLTARDVVGKQNMLVIATDYVEKCSLFADLFGNTMKTLLFEDEDGKPWKISCSFLAKRYLYTKGWSRYVREKKLCAGDFVIFQRHRTDRSRLFIGCRRCKDGEAAPRQLDRVLPSPTSRDISSVQGWSLLGDLDKVSSGPTSMDTSCTDYDWSYVPPDLDPTSLAIFLQGYDRASVLPYPASPSTSSKSLELKAEHKEVETPLQLRLPEHSVGAGFGPILVICCGENQDTEETYFINYIVGELCLRGFTPFRYDITRSTVAGNQDMLHRSQFGIMIVSKNYACSRECLDEFVAIVGHFKANNITTVFFKVSDSDISNQSGSFERAFSQLGNSVQASHVLKWRQAMEDLTCINRYHYIKGQEVMVAKNIVNDVCSLVKSEINKNLEGMTLQLKNILPLLNYSQSSAPHIVGLWGMAGIGKTTIAREIFRTQAGRYDVCYFLPDFNIMCEARGLSHLRDEFLSKILGEEKVYVDACNMKQSFRRDWFFEKRVLIVLDGVTNARDAEVLVGGFDWFSGGHTIIFTSRNRQVLVQCKAKELYEIPKLSESASFRMCCQYGTEQNWKGRITLISELVNYASGIPLALRVLSSCPQKQCINEEELLRRLRQQPPTKIQDAFRRSFDGLEENEKVIFLDLACFFRGENKVNVVNILDGCGFLTDLGVYGLVDESLISLVDNRIVIPNIFQDTGRFVVRQESKEAGKRSRLWDSNDIADVLTNNSGTGAIEGLFLDGSGLTIELNPTVFERMYRLRLLKLYCPIPENPCNISLPQGLHSLPDELRLLHWERYPLRSLPRNFDPKNLVELNMPYSNMKKPWKGTKHLEKLKRIILSHSRQLTRLPSLSKARKLEHIDLEGCTNLVKVNSSILHHHKLTFLSLKDCSQLRIMPTTVHLESLEVLNLSGCSNLEDLKDLSPNLKELYLAETAIRRMPSSLEDLRRLVTLDLENCKLLQHLPPGIRNLKALVTLKLSGCSNLKSHPILDSSFLRESHGLNTKVTMEMPLHLQSAIEKSRGAVEEFLRAFKSPSSNSITQANWSSIRYNFLPSSVFHSLASRLYCLVSLSLCNAGVVDIPEELCWLPSVKELDLGRNSFSRIPNSINELRKLHSLILHHCKNLTSLPELPKSLEILNVHGCVSLKSFPSSFEQFPRHYTFSDCFALSSKVVRKYMKKALKSIEVMANGHQQEDSNAPAFSICVPASTCHKSSFNFQAGSSTRIELTPDMLKKTHSCFALSVVVEFWDNYRSSAGFGIKCICRETRTEFSHQFWAPKEAPHIHKDHMFVFSYVRKNSAEGEDHDVLADVVTFEFYPVNAQNQLLGDSCTVKRCGVHLITAAKGDTAFSAKRPASCMDPLEHMASPYKRCRMWNIIKIVLQRFRKRKRETSDSRVKNHSKVHLGPVSACAKYDQNYRNLEQNEEKKLRPNKLSTIQTTPSQFSSSLTSSQTFFPKLTRSASRIRQVPRVRSLEKKQIKRFGYSNSGASVLSLKIHKPRQADSLGPLRDAAAIKIQTEFRSYRCRKQALQGCIVIQAHWKGYQVRKNYRNSILPLRLVK